MRGASGWMGEHGGRLVRSHHGAPVNPPDQDGNVSSGYRRHQQGQPATMAGTELSPWVGRALRLVMGVPRKVEP
ncbi:MAG: hypothetical protein DLM54_02815 [Acidimicrobiales bacterium]|nr:MAG: hypothetical protein DLM54_02815 [Acidimicrobiales bacterium]